MKMPNSLRTFVSIDVEDEELIRQMQRLQALFPMFRAVAPDQLHLTLKFMGDISEAKIQSIKDQLSAVDARAFSMTLAGMGTFPKLSGRPRPSYVLWVGVTEPAAGKLKEIAFQVENRLEEIGFERERRSFSPHLTIGRGKRLQHQNIQEAGRILMEHLDEEVGSSIVSSLRLKKSTLTPKGPIYETLFENRFPD